jgi:hypothetical protein
VGMDGSVDLGSESESFEHVSECVAAERLVVTSGPLPG